MIFKFNTAKAVAYAYNYLEKPNPFYKIFEGEKEGVSFVSQCILAGCENLNSRSCPNWFYDSEKNYSESWVESGALLSYLLTQNSCGASGRLASRNLLSVGDIVFFETKNQGKGVGLITKICDNEIFFVTKGDLFGEISLDKREYEKLNFVHIIGVKK